MTGLSEQKTIEAETKTYRAGLVVVGDEILTGRTQDANIQWIAEKLGPQGISLSEIRVVPDRQEMIIEAVNALRDRYDYVLTTGGIGPTHDDITSESVARAFGLPLIVHPEAKARLLAHYEDEKHLNAARMKMAQVPEGAELIDNPVSGAPGFRIGNVFVLAGVPRIMRPMLDHAMALMGRGQPYLSNTIACTLMEGNIAADLAELQANYPDVIIGSYPHYRGGTLGLSLVLRSLNNGRLHAATGDLLELIRRHGDDPRAISMMSVTE